MKTKLRFLPRTFPLRAACVTLLVAALHAQTSSSTTSDSTAEKTIRLNPFEVQADRRDSYSALNSNSITGFNVALEKLPISADILDETFLNDVGGDNTYSILQTYANGVSLSPQSAIPNIQPLDPFDSTTAVRGLAAPTYQRDALIAATLIGGGGYGSSFSSERLEVIKGPQSLLYGNGSAGGVVNVVSKKAQLRQPATGRFEYQVDQWGHSGVKLDYGMGTDRAAVRIAATSQNVGNRQLNIGGPMRGYYGQFAFALPLHTTLRLSAEHTSWERQLPNYLTFTGASTANDARNGQNLGYLLATNQINASATGASGAGVVDNGHLTWDNYGSLVGRFYETNAKSDYDMVSLESQWTDWLSTIVTAAWSDMATDNAKQSYTLYAPNASANPLGVWAVGTTNPLSIASRENDVWRRGLRGSVLFTHHLFGGKVLSKTNLGADFTRLDSLNESRGFYQADANWNLVLNAAGARIPLPSIFWSVANGPVKYPVFSEFDRRLVYNGVNYIQQLANPIDNSLVSPANPLGVTSTTSTNTYTFTHVLNRGYYGVNYAEWLGGRLTTLAGFRATDYYSMNVTGTTKTTQIVQNSNHSMSFGATYKLNDWLYPYVGYSDSYNQPVQLTNDPYGVPARVSHGKGEEAGVKISVPGGRLSATLAFFNTQSKDEQYFSNGTVSTAINPNGLNGTAFPSPGSAVSVDRDSRGGELTLTGNPTPNWRVRLGGAYIAAAIGTTKNYDLLYNDQFHADAAGTITYADGAPVYVLPTYTASRPVVPAGTANAFPLTIALLTTQGSPYYANPNAISGAINTSTAAATVLRQVDPVHGAILTGKTGLPISALQLHPGFTPPTSVNVVSAGDRVTGSPKFSSNFTNMYTFSQGWLKGLRLGGTVALAWKNISYYYYPTGVDPRHPPVPFYMPTSARLDVILGYEKHFRRLSWNAQLNIGNATNHYHVLVYPNQLTGWTGINTANFDQQPRSYVLQTGIRF